MIKIICVTIIDLVVDIFLNSDVARFEFSVKHVSQVQSLFERLFNLFPSGKLYALFLVGFCSVSLVLSYGTRRNKNFYHVNCCQVN